MKIFIAGSCVTRDAFTPDTKEDFEIVNYYARYSLARLNYPAITLDMSDTVFEKKVPSPFQRKILKNEFSNNLIESINEADFDYLVIDCVDERFGLIEFSKSVYLTNSDEFKKSKLIDSKAAIKIPPHSTDFFTYYRKGLEKVISVVGAEKIIINNVFWTNKLDNGDSISSLERVSYCNDMVNNLYKIASEYIPEKQFVNYPSDIFIGDSQHKWGKSPFHYTKEVYIYLQDYLLRIKNNSN